MQIVEMDGNFVITYLDPLGVQRTVGRSTTTLRGRRRTSRSAHDPAESLPELVGALLFVRRLGGAFFGRDHRDNPTEWGDEIIVLTTVRQADMAGARTIPPVTMKGRSWHAWQVTLPPQPDHRFSERLGRIDIRVASPTWRPMLVTPPESYQASEVAFRSSTPVTVKRADGETHLVTRWRLPKLRGKFVTKPGPNLVDELQQILAPDGCARIEVRGPKSSLSWTVVNAPQPDPADHLLVTIGDLTVRASSNSIVDRADDLKVSVRALTGTTVSLTATEPVASSDPQSRHLADASAVEASAWIREWIPSYSRFVVDAAGALTRTFVVRSPAVTTPSSEALGRRGSPPNHGPNTPDRRARSRSTEPETMCCSATPAGV